jgi:hypothetical protein
MQNDYELLKNKNIIMAIQKQSQIDKNRKDCRNRHWIKDVSIKLKFLYTFPYFNVTLLTKHTFMVSKLYTEAAFHPRRARPLLQFSSEEGSTLLLSFVSHCLIRLCFDNYQALLLWPAILQHHPSSPQQPLHRNTRQNQRDLQTTGVCLQWKTIR